MTFELLLDELRNGKTFEKFCAEHGAELVECCDNEAFVDDNLECFLETLDATIEDYSAGYALINTKNNKYYELKYRDIENRFDKNLPDETIISFDYNEIYDVTDNYI